MADDRLIDYVRVRRTSDGQFRVSQYSANGEQLYVSEALTDHGYARSLAERTAAPYGARVVDDTEESA